MTLRTAELMQGADPFRTGPGVGEQRIGRGRAAPSVTGITRRGAGEVGRSLQDRMGRAGAVRMAVKIGDVASRAGVWCCTRGIGAGSN